VTLIEEAYARRERASVAGGPRRIDYDRMNRVMPSQKRALTRAINDWKRAGGQLVRANDPEYPGTLAAAEHIARVCKAAVVEWNEIGAWPDQWHTWNIALRDATGLELDEL
jgi:hypothetical protein